jgi:DNA-directed RNA polymerase subunit K
MTIDIDPLGPEEYTKYERARLIGSRALQISMGAPILIKLTPKQLEEVRFNPIEIAKLEFEEGVLPIGVKRLMPHER